MFWKQTNLQKQSLKGNVSFLLKTEHSHGPLQVRNAVAALLRSASPGGGAEDRAKCAIPGTRIHSLGRAQPGGAQPEMLAGRQATAHGPAETRGRGAASCKFNSRHPPQDTQEEGPGRPSSQHREEGGFLTGTGKGGAARHCDQSPAAETCARGSGRPLRTTSPPAPLPSSTPLPAGRSGQAPAPGSAM